jgi:hypothetical protein
MRVTGHTLTVRYLRGRLVDARCRLHRWPLGMSTLGCSQALLSQLENVTCCCRAPNQCRPRIEARFLLLICRSVGIETKAGQGGSLSQLLPWRRLVTLWCGHTFSARGWFIAKRITPSHSFIQLCQSGKWCHSLRSGITCQQCLPTQLQLRSVRYAPNNHQPGSLPSENSVA